MGTPARNRVSAAEVPLLPVVALVAVLALAGGLLNIGSAVGPVAGTTTITVTRAPSGRRIPAGFLGLSLEYPAVLAYAGSDPAAIDPVFVRLIRRLTAGGQVVLRIGGDSADRSWWPVAALAHPPGVSYALTHRWLDVAAALVRKLGAPKLIVGLNLEAGNPQLAAAEVRALDGGLPPGSVLAFQLGNEPELYGSFAWYRTPGGQTVRGRPPGYGFDAFSHDFTSFAGGLPGVPLAGPSTGGLGWQRYLPRFLTAQPQLKLVTVHRYPLQLCFLAPSSPRYPTIKHLLSPAASTGLADSFKPDLATAHAHGLPFRVDELNTVSCGADRAVSQSFASALWVLDTLFELARVGADGVNIHTFPGAGYELFRLTEAGARWRASVAPEYDGVRMFADAAPPGARLQHVSGDPRDGSLKVWASTAPDGRTRIVLINKSESATRIVVQRAPGVGGSATLERLSAPSSSATSGVSLHTGAITPTGGAYRITLPAASAALLTAAVPPSVQTPRRRAAASAVPRSRTRL